jgi:hypothetical protein
MRYTRGCLIKIQSTWDEMCVRIALLVQLLTVGWAVLGSNLVGTRLSIHEQTGPGAHPASCIVGTGSFPEVKQVGHGIKHPPLFSAEVNERVELYIYSLSEPLWCGIEWTLPYMDEIHIIVDKGLYEACVEPAVLYRVVARWVCAFQGGRESCKHKLGASWPITAADEVDGARVSTLLDINWLWTCVELSSEVGTGNFKMQKICAQWPLHTKTQVAMYGNSQIALEFLWIWRWSCSSLET